MFVLGTAGHIDHGKSSLIRAMTGIDPDRLPQEKERGMTIDLGFAWLRLPNGEEIGLIDVPGHERFVRNMVAGAGGVNAAMLVIAADDGWMPQTQEHLDILRLLDIRHGLVAITKTDLVEADWLELVMADVRAKLQGTFLAEAPLVPVSSETGQGVAQVVEGIAEIASRLKEVEDIGKARLFVDRSFVLTGIGVVATGTSRGGGFSADSDVYHFPAGQRAKIRSLQSHEKKVDRVGPGTRVAINLTGVDRSEMKRGHVITGFDFVSRPRYFAVSVRNLVNSTISLTEGRKVLLIHGTTETEAIMRPFDEKGIKPGDEGLAIIKTDQPLAAFVLDHVILRLPTPQVTVGGGRILDILDQYPRRKNLPDLRGDLEKRAAGDIRALILTELSKRFFTPETGLLLYADVSERKVRAEVSTLIDGGLVIRHEGRLAVESKISGLFTPLETALRKTHRSKSYLKGLTVEELARNAEISNGEQFLIFLKYLEYSGRLGRTNQFYHLPDFSPTLDEKMEAQAEKILGEAERAGHSYLTFDDIEARYPNSRRTINFLRDEGRLKVIGTRMIVTAKVWNEILDYLGEILAAGGKMTVAEYRDRFGSTRKYALPLLEYLDQIGITRREGDYRIQGARFDERHTL